VNNEFADPELAILENIYDTSRLPVPLRQRDLAQVAGASLGMTNSILKRLAVKGLITVRRINSRNIHYAVTPDGISEIARRSYRYFKRTIRNVVFYRERLDEALALAKQRRVGAVLLVGLSDLDFIVEHACARHGISFLKALDEDTARRMRKDGFFLVVAENIPAPPGEGSADELYLSRILSGNDGGRH